MMRGERECLYCVCDMSRQASVSMGAEGKACRGQGLACPCGGQRRRSGRFMYNNDIHGTSAHIYT